MSSERKNNKTSGVDSLLPEIFDRVNQACQKISQKEDKEEFLDVLDNLVRFLVMVLAPESVFDEAQRLAKDKFVKVPTGTFFQCYTRDQVNFLINNFSGEEVKAPSRRQTISTNLPKVAYLVREKSKITPEFLKII